MSTYLESFILFILCATLFPYEKISAAFIAGVLLVFAFYCFMLVAKKEKVLVFWGILALLLCLIIPEISIFIPLLCYIFFYKKQYVLPCLYVLPAVIYLHGNQSYVNLLILPLTALSFYFAYQNEQRNKLRKTITEFRDNSVEQEMTLKKKNIQLLESQNDEIYIATLKERNRIAREIHDSVGHMLSRSILQVGALLTISKDETINPHLETLKNTLNEAMNSIRNSVHDLHDESVDLQDALNNLVKAFTFCPIQFDCDISKHVPKDIKYCFIAITKEALNNIIKHSKATKVTLTVKEHPGFYQLLIEDNGKSSANIATEHLGNNGIGLTNMKERVETIHGILHISTEHGFRIFVSVPK